MLVALIGRKMTRLVPSKRSVAAGVTLGVLLFLGYAFQTVGLLYTTSSKAGFITGLSVMIVPLLSIWILKETARKTVYAAAAVGTAGLYFLTFSGFSSFNQGDLLVFCCALAFALHILFTGKFSGQHDAWLLTIVQLFTVSVLSFSASGLFESVPDAGKMLTADVLLALFITAFFATAFAFLFRQSFSSIRQHPELPSYTHQSLYLQRLLPISSQVSASLQPVSSAVCSFFLRC